MLVRKSRFTPAHLRSLWVYQDITENTTSSIVIKTSHFLYELVVISPFLFQPFISHGPQVQNQADKWWGLKKISFKGLLVDPIQSFQTNIIRFVWQTIRIVRGLKWKFWVSVHLHNCSYDWDGKKPDKVYLCSLRCTLTSVQMLKQFSLLIYSNWVCYMCYYCFQGCDDFTHNFLRKLGVRIRNPEHIPTDPYTDHRKKVCF